VSSLQTQAELIVASFDLKVVQLIRGAMRAADLQGQRDALMVPAPTIEPRPHLHPDEVVEPRRHIHPAPVYDNPQLIHQKARVALEPNDSTHSIPQSSDAPPAKTSSPIQPPWKVLPWPQPISSRQTVKVHRLHTDVSHRGAMLDLFV
jgi:hypothetical protein